MDKHQDVGGTNQISGFKKVGMLSQGLSHDALVDHIMYFDLNVLKRELWSTRRRSAGHDH